MALWYNYGGIEVFFLGFFFWFACTKEYGYLTLLTGGDGKGGWSVDFLNLSIFLPVSVKGIRIILIYQEQPTIHESVALEILYVWTKSWMNQIKIYAY